MLDFGERARTYRPAALRRAADSLNSNCTFEGAIGGCKPISS